MHDATTLDPWNGCANPKGWAGGVREDMIFRALHTRIRFLMPELRAMVRAHDIMPQCSHADYAGHRNEVDELAARGASEDRAYVLCGKRWVESPSEAFSSYDILSGRADVWILTLWHQAAARTEWYRTQRDDA